MFRPAPQSAPLAPGVGVQFSEVVRDKWDRLVSAASRYRRSAHEDSEDVVQDGLVSAWERLGKFEGRSSLWTWVFAVVRHRAISGHRGSRSPSEQTLRIGAEALSRRVADQDRSEWAAALREEFDRAIGEMAEADLREVVLLTLDGLTPQEIAERVGAPSATVRTRLFRARRELRRRLEARRECFELRPPPVSPIELVSTGHERGSRR